MRCEDAVDAIQDVMKGAGTPMELARRLPAAVQAHLQGCTACRNSAHELLSLDRDLQLLTGEAPPPGGLLSSIMASVRAAPAGGEELRLEPLTSEDWKEAAARPAREAALAGAGPSGVAMTTGATAPGSGASSGLGLTVPARGTTGRAGGRGGTGRRPWGMATAAALMLALSGALLSSGVLQTEQAETVLTSWQAELSAVDWSGLAETGAAWLESLRTALDTFSVGAADAMSPLLAALCAAAVLAAALGLSWRLSGARRAEVR